MKKILFVINTMGRAGAEQALLSLLHKLNKAEYDISLFILTGQGEMIDKLPPYVRIVNPSYSTETVLSKKGRIQLMKTVLKSFFRNGHIFHKSSFLIKNFLDMKKKGNFQADKLFWRILSDGGIRFKEHFDLAVAFLEGGSSYYVADHVKAQKKAAFIHTDYSQAGYTPTQDQDCWEHFDRIFAISEDVQKKFMDFYPQQRDKMALFPNIVDQELIRRRAKEPGGFTDDYNGYRILTVGRLTYLKGYDIAIDAMKLLKDAGCPVKWYALGEGDQRKNLEKKIAQLNLDKDFLLLGAAENPYPYYAQTDLYVHATRIEGKSIAIQEAQTLGCPVIVSDCCSGSNELIENGKYGISCKLTPEGIAESIHSLLADENKRKELGKLAATKKIPDEQIEMLTALL